MNINQSFGIQLENVNLKTVFQKVDISINVEDWPYAPQHLGKYDVGLCINMIHISPIECTTGLFRNMAKVCSFFFI